MGQWHKRSENYVPDRKIRELIDHLAERHSLMYTRGYETAIYLLSGRVETHYRPGLCNSITNETGNFIFVSVDVPHRSVNLSCNQWRSLWHFCARRRAHLRVLGNEPAG